MHGAIARGLASEAPYLLEVRSSLAFSMTSGGGRQRSRPEIRSMATIYASSDYLWLARSMVTKD